MGYRIYLVGMIIIIETLLLQAQRNNSIRNSELELHGVLRSQSGFPDRGSRIADPKSRLPDVITVNNLAWAGGMNACQFCEIDLDLDGTMDLLLFDRHGNRLIPLVYRGPAGSFNYQPDTTYTALFPDLHDWVSTADYDCDGRMDLFTYGLGSIRVFRNVSDTSLRFRLITSMLTSWYYTGYIGVLVSPVDYPAIADLDGDGDLDVLTFFGLGSFVEYHRNQSVELYGNCDSLDFRMANNCWGKFKESEGSNKITLNADCPGSKYELRMTNDEFRDRHTGSTMLALDLNGDGPKDLVLGDVDFPNLIALFNGGTPDTALITSFDTIFPAGTHTVKLFDFPLPSFTDVDHDGLKDLLVSSFNPQLTIPDDHHSSWFYRNTGTGTLPRFVYQTDRFFQDQMIDAGSGSYPVLYDLDEDGLTDLLIGCWGRYDSSVYQAGILRSVHTSRISFYRNTGSAWHPAFTFVTDDLGGFSSFGLTGMYPSFADLNGDGGTDLVIGQEDGTLAYLENRNPGSYPPDFLPPQWKYEGIDVGENSAPQLFDLDADGLSDLIIGERNGNLNYYRNTGIPGHPSFTFVTDSLGKVNVTDYQLSYYGYSVPCFFRDGAGREHLIAGSEQGKIWYFEDIPADPETPYQESYGLTDLIADHPFPLKCGWRTAPAIRPLTDSLRFDLLVGNYAGGLNYFSQAPLPDVMLGMAAFSPQQRVSFLVYPNPAREHIYFSIPPSLINHDFRIEILNLFGQVLLREFITPGEPLSVRLLPDGLYLVTLNDPSGNISFTPQKLIIRK